MTVKRLLLYTNPGIGLSRSGGGWLNLNEWRLRLEFGTRDSMIGAFSGNQSRTVKLMLTPILHQSLPNGLRELVLNHRLINLFEECSLHDQSKSSVG